MRSLAIGIVAIVSGCATQEQVYLPDGRQGYSIECGGAAQSWQLCYKQAGKTCGARGYDIIERHESSTPNGAATQYGAIIGANVQRTMLISCR